MTTKGLERLKAKLKRYPKELKVRLRGGLDESADELIAMQKRLAPQDEGDLVESIRKEPGRHELAIRVVAGGLKAFWARFQEFGTPFHAAQPFFFPAYRALRKRIKSRLTRVASKTAKLVAGNGL